MNRLPRLVRSIVLAVIALASASTGCSDSTPSASPTSERTINVETITAEAADVDIVLDAVGAVDASEKAEIRPQVDGIVAELAFAEGARVAEGDLLVRLDDAKPVAKLELARASLDSAKARLRLAEQRLRRGRQLIAEELISREAFDQLESEHLAADAAVREGQAAVTLASRELDDYRIRAPFSGTVGARKIDVGNYVQKGAALVSLIKTDPVEIAFRAPDQYAARIRTGIPVRVSLPTREGSVEATLSFINPRVDPTTRMLDLKAVAANPDGMLRDGQFVSVRVLLDVRASQVLLPEETVITTAGELAVYVVVDGIAHRRAITIGVRQPPKVEVLSGVRPGETVVVGGQHRLHDGARVAVVAHRDDGA
jgi:membrane fusion protein (multidrug efflux system)